MLAGLVVNVAEEAEKGGTTHIAVRKKKKKTKEVRPGTEQKAQWPRKGQYACVDMYVLVV